MSIEEALELAIHRSLRAEVPPSVRGIVVANMSPDLVELQVFHYGPVSELANFDEIVESELQQCLPSGVTKAPQLRVKFLPAETFEVLPSHCIVHNNPWAAA